MPPPPPTDPRPLLAGAGIALATAIAASAPALVWRGMPLLDAGAWWSLASVTATGIAAWRLAACFAPRAAANDNARVVR